MTLFTKKGDSGTTTTFGCNQRISKSAPIAEALGTVDELNSFLGICKLRASEAGLDIKDEKVADLTHDVQEKLFVVQAELAGADMRLEEAAVKKLEKVTNAIEVALPPIKTFFISGGSTLASHFDYARTLARRAERRVIAVQDEGKKELGASTLAYLNRLSSLLYALARYANHEAGAEEEPPSYE